MDAPDESMTTDLLSTQVSLDDTRYAPGDQIRYAALVETIRRPADVALLTDDLGDGRWRVVISTSDCVGLLSLIAGLFTAHRLDILQADIVTVHLPVAPVEGPSAGRRHGRSRSGLPVVAAPPAHRLLDIFEVRPLGEVGPAVWERFRADLADLVGLLIAGQRDQARDVIVDRVSAVIGLASPSAATLLPITIDLTNEPGALTTRLTVHSADTPGFLFAFTNALAGFTINIERAEIRTDHDEAHDIFWVTDVGGGQIVGDAHSHHLRVATSLIKQFTHLLPRSPDPGQALRQFNALIAQMLSRPAWTEELTNLESPAVLATLADLMGVSRFLWEDFLRMQHESLFPVLVDVPALREPRSKPTLRDDLLGRLAASADQTARVEILNTFKDREMFRIDLRHITGQTDFVQFSEELTELADVTVAITADLCHAALAPTVGVPTLADGQPCGWSICALGKFGGRELGFGSDLELIFVYAGEGTTTGPTAIPNAEYFIRFVQTFLSTLRVRQEGIFEIDLRLRPHGKAGALACSAGGFARYYREHGPAEQFERMALVRLRPVAGDDRLGQRLTAARDAFVYAGRPLDLDNVRHLRHRQATELVAPSHVNAKYSVGGLVDVEYYCQSWQIAVGQADPAVRVTNTLAAIYRLAANGHLAVDRAARLRAAYSLLRRLIDALRAVRGHAKDLTVPPADSREYAYLAQRLHYPSPDDLRTALTAAMADARTLWEQAPPPGR